MLVVVLVVVIIVAVTTTTITTTAITIAIHRGASEVPDPALGAANVPRAAAQPVHGTPPVLRGGPLGAPQAFKVKLLQHCLCKTGSSVCRSVSCSHDALLDWGQQSRHHMHAELITTPAVAELDVLAHSSPRPAGQYQQGSGGDVALACGTELQDAIS